MRTAKRAPGSPSRRERDVTARETGPQPQRGGRIMRTNANSRSPRCGQAFICHALAAARGRYGTQRASRGLSPHGRVFQSPSLSPSLFLFGRARVQFAVSRCPPSPTNFRERPRRSCILPQLSATVISLGYFGPRCRQHRHRGRVLLSHVLFY